LIVFVWGATLLLLHQLHSRRTASCREHGQFLLLTQQLRAQRLSKIKQLPSSWQVIVQEWDAIRNCTQY
jgi:hypothetical protein